MKLKTSYFNKTIFRKNVTLYWPIWGIYTFILMCAMPFYLWLEYNDGYRTTPLTDAQKFSRLCDVLELTPFYTFIIAFTAVIAGMALFSYLYNSKSANMIHSLPVNRTELFATNVISGISFLAVPQIIVFVMTLLVCLTEGVYQVEYLAMWLFVSFATDIIAFSVVTFCAMFTGLLLALPIYVVVLNCLAYVIAMLLELIVSTFGYGVILNNMISESLLIWLSPLMCYMEKVYMIGVYQNGSARAMQLQGLDCIVIYLVMAFVLYALAYFVYQKRKIEQAGDLITVGFVKPIFRCGVGAIVAMYGSIMFRAIFMEFGITIHPAVFILLLLIIGMIAYFIADMFVRKTFRVFKKKNWINCGVFLVALLVGFGAMYGYAVSEEHKLPEAEDVKYAYIDMGYMVRYEGEDVSAVTEVHKKILDNLSYYEELDETNYYWNYADIDYERIYIYYVLKSGEAFYRSYRVPMEDEGKEIIDAIYAIEQQPENFLKNEFCNSYEDVTEFTEGYIDFQYYTANGSSIEYFSKEMTEAQTKILYDAVIADTLAGNLMKYNTYYRGLEFEKEYNEYTYYLQIGFEIPNEEAEKTFWDYYNEQYNGFMSSHSIETDETNASYVGISFGKDCTNIINAMYECGFVNEAWTLYWGEEMEWQGNNTMTFLYNSLGFDFDFYEIEKFVSGGLSFARYETDANGNKVYSNEYLPLTAEQVSQLYYGVIGDAKEETIFKYNPNYVYGEEYLGEDSVFLLSLSYVHPEYDTTYSAEFFFGSDCQYILETIVDLGIAESLEDICWDSYYSY